MANVKKTLPDKLFSDETKNIILNKFKSIDEIAECTGRSANMVYKWLDHKAVIPDTVAKQIAIRCGLSFFDIRPDLEIKNDV